jgi:hypothetical protein
MLFLLNDAMLDFRAETYHPPVDAARFDALSLSFVLKLGQEMFSESPLLHRDEPERARRLAMLIAAKAPEVNAALFVAPNKGCRPDQVITRLANLGLEVIMNLYSQDRIGALNPVTADREVWRRMAA